MEDENHNTHSFPIDGETISGGYDTEARREPVEMAPIDKLPLELLAYILYDSLTHIKDDPYPDYRRISSLTLVSRRWYLTVNQFPQFWSSLSDQLPPKLVSRILSKDALLRVQVHCKLPNISNEWFRIVLNTIDRIKELKLHVEGIYPDAFQDLDAPVLEALTATGVYQLLPTLSSAPRLRKVELERTLIDWSSPIYHQLQVLQIDTLQKYNSPALSVFVELLRNTVQLQELTLFDAPLPYDAHNLTHEIIHLPSLRTLMFGAVPESCFYILKWVRAPKIELRNICPQRDDSRYLTASNAAILASTMILPDGIWELYTIVCGDEDIYLDYCYEEHTKGSRLVFENPWPFGDVLAFFKLILDAHKSSAPVCIRVQDADMDYSSQETFSIFTNMPRVMKLEVAHYLNVTAFVELLGRPKPVGPGSESQDSEYAFPHLTHLALRSYCDGATLLGTLSARGTGLEEVTISGRMFLGDPSLRERIENVIGRDRLRVEPY